jgi:hypothetical protein
MGVAWLALFYIRTGLVGGATPSLSCYRLFSQWHQLIKIKSEQTGDAIAKAQQSTSYSSTFSIVLPQVLPSSPSPEPGVVNTAITSTPPRSQTPPTPQPYLANLRPLFPPAPFTPAHPVFLHLSAFALQQSQELRTAAEEYVQRVVKEKSAEVERAENELRRQVEMLWKIYRGGVGRVERERNQTRSRSITGNRDIETRPQNGSMVSPGQSTPVAIRDFVPMQSPPPRSPVVASIPRISSLSASLVPVAFHHPRATSLDSRTTLAEPILEDGEQPRTPSVKRLSLSSASSQTGSSLASSSSITIRVKPDAGNIVEPFRRNMDQSRDTAASYRYFTNLEADMARAGRAKPKEEPKKPTAPRPVVDVNATTKEVGPTTSTVDANAPNSNGHNRDGSSQSDAEAKTGVASPSPLSPKGKRKVTFNVQPAVVTIKREVNAEKAEEALTNRDTGEMIFDLEDEGSERSFSETVSRPILPLLETAPTRAPRNRVSRPSINSGLPESLSALRPASLPVPSQMRPPRSQNGSDTSSQSMRISQALSKPPSEKKVKTEVPEPPEDPRETEILKLVAANTPSHRGAWKRDSKAWQTFVRRQDEKLDGLTSTLIPEEGDDDITVGLSVKDDSDEETDSDELNGGRYPPAFIGSLPMSINPKLPPKQALSLASYQPQTCIPDRSDVPAPPGISNHRAGVPSSAILRKAAYAERDRGRSMDPGALDFAAEEDEEDIEDSDDEDSQVEHTETGERGRKRALKILQARSELPAAGMWRSLA